MEESFVGLVRKGIETRYFGSTLGNVGSMCSGEMKLLKQKTRKDKYKEVGLSINGKQISELVHRIIAMCFVPNPNNYKEVNHKDGVKGNNEPSNLEWCTNQQNMTHAKLHGLRPKGENHGSSKITETIVIEIFRLYNVENWTQQRIADNFGIVQMQVSYILSRKRWGHVLIPAEYL